MNKSIYSRWSLLAVVAAALFSLGSVASVFADAAAPAAADSEANIAAYPLTTCVVSDEALDSDDMGGPINYIYKSEGQPDRLVRLCCKRCIKKFNAEPQKYLKMIDEAAAKKAAK